MLVAVGTRLRVLVRLSVLGHLLACSRGHMCVCVCVEEAALGWQLGALNPSFTHTLIESQASGEGREGGQWV